MTLRKQNPNPGQPRAEERLLAAAAAEFAAKGFYGARTQAIADAAGVNKAMLHYYFRSKERLYRQVIRAAFQGLLARIQGVVLADEPLGLRLERLVELYLETYAQNPALLKIVLREALEGGQRLRRALAELTPGPGPGLGPGPAEMLARVGAELNLEPGETLQVLLNLIGMCLISFISPPLLEGLIGYDASDFEAHLRRRRAAIISAVQAWLSFHLDSSNKEKA